MIALMSPRDDLVEEVHFDAADAFLDALQPTTERWRARPGTWIFRGHADASWRLVPSVNRRTNLRKFLPDVPEPVGEELYWEPTFEDVMGLLKDFADALERAGHEVPEKKIRRQMVDLEFWVSQLFASQELHELEALAQHHGIPTRLLDWTRYAKVAAYIAASDVVSAPAADGDLAVWAFDITDERNPQGYLGFFDERVGQLRVVESSRAGNPNLHAQAGLFTLAAASMTPPALASKVELVTVDEIVAASGDVAALKAPMFYKLTLPRSEAGSLLRWLAHEPVTGAILFPGLDGVARDVRDRRRWPK
jgi:hypothetical protein